MFLVHSLFLVSVCQFPEVLFFSLRVPAFSNFLDFFVLSVLDLSSGLFLVETWFLPGRPPASVPLSVSY